MATESGAPGASGGDVASRWVPASLRGRLLLLVLFALLPALALILYTNVEQRHQALASARDETLRLVHLVASDQAHVIEGARQLLTALARLPEVRGRDGPGCGTHLADLLGAYPQYANLGAAAPDGSAFCSALPMPGPLSAADRPYFQLALRTRRFSIGEYQIGRVTRKATLNLGHPILDATGEVRGVVFAALDLAWLNASVARTELPREATLSVIDARGVILARYPDPGAWVGKTAPEATVLHRILAHAQQAGTVEVQDRDGRTSLYAVTRLTGAPEGGHLAVAIGIPRAAALAEADAVLRRNLIGLGVAALLVLGVAWSGADRLVLRPANALLRATQRLAAGDLSARTGLPPGTGELSALAQAFDATAAALQRQRAEAALADEALRESETRFRLAFDDSTLGMALQTLDGHYLQVNHALCAMLGYTERDLLQTNYQTLTHPDDLPADVEHDRRMLGGDIRGFQVEKRYLHRGGHVIWALTTVSCLRTLSGEPLYVLAQLQDITERTHAVEVQAELEAQLRQAHKMEAIGRLAGGVAHDFNNLLTVIGGRSELLLHRLAPDDPTRRQVQTIKQAADRAEALTRQLLAFSRKQPIEPRVVDLTTVVASAETMLRRLIGEDVELVWQPGPDAGRVKADPSQIEQVVLNLAVNARDAMPLGGQLTIETSNVELDAAFAADNPGARPGAYVRLQLRDTGVGMDAATRARCFEPFFTTKDVGRGTGLGLSTVYGIVKQHGGYIQVESEVGAGTSVAVYLPRVADAAEPVSEAPAATEVSGGTETILLVEDEAAVRTVTEEILHLQGYAVLTARHAADALLQSDRHTGPIHLLLTDVVMPGLTGRQLAERLTRLRPEMKVLYVSGYTDDALLLQGTRGAGIALLRKPFAPDGLARRVREVLDTVTA